MKDIKTYELVRRPMLDSNGRCYNLTAKTVLVASLRGLLVNTTFSKDSFIETAMTYLKLIESNHKDDKSRLVSAKQCFAWMMKNDFLKFSSMLRVA